MYRFMGQRDATERIQSSRQGLASEYLLSYFGSKDMGVAHTLFRRFIWSDNALWKEDVQGHHVAVVLAGKDVIVDTKVIGAYLTGADY
jgi:hypothetical protein